MSERPNNAPKAGVRLMRALLALGVVNLLLVAPLWWRDGEWGSAWLVPEVGLLLSLALWPYARRSNGLQWLLAGVLTFSTAALLGDALVRAVFARPLDIVLDPLLLVAGFRLIAGSLGLWAAVLASLLAAAGVVLTAYVMRRLQGRALGHVPPAGGLAVTLIAFVVLAVELRAPDGGIVRPALVDLAQAQATRARDTLAERDALLDRAASPEMAARPIPALAGRDVIFVFVESYGASALDQDRYADTIRPVLARARARLAERGLHAVSTRMRSPIRGGQSWLAHASALSGQAIDNNYWYSLLLESGQDMLTDDFRATGHTPLVVAPAIVQPWPEAERLGFDAVYPGAALGYAGPSTGWVGIPDPFTLRRYSRDLRPRHDGAVFAMLMLISSHAPWSPNPPLPRDPAMLDRANPWPDWSAPERDPLAYWRDTDKLRERYPASIAYSLEATFDFAARALPDDALLVVIGDHQPATLVTGPDAGSDVPVHFVSSDAALLERIDIADPRPGLVPGPDSSSDGLGRLRFALRELGRGSDPGRLQRPAAP